MSSMAGPKMAARALVSRLLTAVPRALTASSGEPNVLPVGAEAVSPFTEKAAARHRATVAANGGRTGRLKRLEKQEMEFIRKYAFFGFMLFVFFMAMQVNVGLRRRRVLLRLRLRGWLIPESWPRAPRNRRHRHHRLLR